MKRTDLDVELLRLKFPSLVVFFGVLLFYTQVVFGWWTPGSLSDLALKAVSLGVLLGGFFLAVPALVDCLKRTHAEFRELRLNRWVAGLAIAAFLAVFGISFFSAIKPAHMIQEGDFVQYHLLLAKQHWLKGSWKAIEWNQCEFLLMSIQYGLSFLWVSLPLLNKLPQFLIACFLTLNVWFLFRLLKTENAYTSAFLALCCFFAFRGVSIQMGTSQLDLVILYFWVSLAVAFVYFLKKQKESVFFARKRAAFSFLVGLELAIYLGHKSFGFLFLGFCIAFSEVLLRMIFKTSWRPFLKQLRWSWVLLPVVVVWIPNVARTFYFTGDPFFPVFTQLSEQFCKDARLTQRSCADVTWLSKYLQYLALKTYGYGTGIVPAIEAFFRVAFHDPIFSRRGLFLGNNRFDYPLGLFWIWSWGFLVFALIRLKQVRKAAIFSLIFSLGFFAFWAMGSQQSRWLYPVLLVLSLFAGYALGESHLFRRSRSGLVVVLALGVLASATRIVLYQHKTLGCFGAECLRSRPGFFEDYKVRCPQGGLDIDNPVWRGYFQCAINKGPKTDVSPQGNTE